MQELRDAFTKVLKEGTASDLATARELAERFLRQVHYHGMSLADQQRTFVSAFADSDRRTLLELVQFATDEQVRSHSRDALGLGPEKPVALETKPTRSVFGNVDNARTI